MAINFNNALGIHPQALMLREKRGEILASNLANADTPDYKARDLDFKAVFQQTLSDGGGELKRSHSGHLAGQHNVLGADLLYRNPQHASLDGNTVETHIEQAKYAENAVQYEASLRFINDDFLGLMTAIKGE
ncbi:flagellar basal body rod protein FlgB [Methylomonas sp. EFPC3]|uniref:flagellar basal body rod protein FlgB n=1 Tax=Methylomonas TaxID=416 RepID=UPI00112D9DC5|nr:MULTISPECIES: flagellar basal body rod protein FlgB [Methylomonas]TPQ26674.1 flagellar basal body rod protein FlgB [Methylomonas koyamae]WFP49949.1 flagellar basal body rod protein FlgB [Methylomonas sp. EFPC3]